MLRRNLAFNLKEGNNAAYFIDKDELFLIDCGILVFAKLLKTTILRIFECPSNTYNLINEKDFDNKYNSFREIKYIKTKHHNIIPAHSLIFNTNNGIIYYSNDLEESKIITDLINSNNKIDKLYVDVTNIDLNNNVHLYIGTLKEIIPDYLKDKTYCMHLNNSTLITSYKF